MAIREISDKTWEKWLKEDLELHKRVITSYLWQEGINSSGRLKFFRLYDYYININNIRDYMHIPAYIFVRALVQGDLNKVKSFIQSKPSPKEHDSFTQIAKEQKRKKRKKERTERRKRKNKE